MSLGAFAVGAHGWHGGLVGVQFERVGEDDPFERLVLVVRSACHVALFDFDGGDVVGQQQPLVGMQFGGVLAGQVFVCDEVRECQYSIDESAFCRWYNRVMDGYSCVARTHTGSPAPHLRLPRSSISMTNATHSVPKTPQGLGLAARDRGRDERTSRSTTTGAFIWSVADLLRGVYKQSEYGRVVLPLTVLRRLDCVLEPTKDMVLSVGAKLPASLENRGPVLEHAAGQSFYNTSKPHLHHIAG